MATRGRPGGGHTCARWWDGVSVDEHLRASRGEQDGQPVQEAGAEAVLAEDVEEERPANGVKSASQVQLQEDARGAELVQKARRLVHEDEIVVQAAAGDECVLARADEAMELWCKAERQDLGKDFGNEVN